MAPPKGKSNNPKGRPPKSRALTEVLEKAGSKTVEVDGKKVSGKRLVASMAWELVATGRVRLSDGRELVADLKDWFEVVKWIYAQVDGPPKGEVDLTSGGKPVTFTLRIGETDGDGDAEV